MGGGKVRSVEEARLGIGTAGTVVRTELGKSVPRTVTVEAKGGLNLMFEVMFMKMRL